jgi:hypothetical protein
VMNVTLASSTRPVTSQQLRWENDVCRLEPALAVAARHFDRNGAATASMRRPSVLSRPGTPRRHPNFIPSEPSRVINLHHPA